MENIYLYNEQLLHLVDDIFWHMGFKSAEHADQVFFLIIMIIASFLFIVIIVIILIILII